MDDKERIRHQADRYAALRGLRFGLLHPIASILDNDKAKADREKVKEQIQRILRGEG